MPPFPRPSLKVKWRDLASPGTRHRSAHAHRAPLTGPDCQRQQTVTSSHQEHYYRSGRYGSTPRWRKAIRFVCLCSIIHRIRQYITQYRHEIKACDILIMFERIHCTCLPWNAQNRLPKIECFFAMYYSNCCTVLPYISFSFREYYSKIDFAKLNKCIQFLTVVRDCTFYELNYLENEKSHQLQLKLLFFIMSATFGK